MKYNEGMEVVDMFQRKWSVLFVMAILGMVFSAWALATPVLIDHTTVLSGKVLTVVQPGDKVKEGSVLVTVGTLAGPNAATRAKVDGTVKEVLIKTGDAVRQGDLVVRIEQADK